jgi:hypothetical protein
MRPLLLSLVFCIAALGVLGLKGCIEARCMQNTECPAGEICVTAIGLCEIPQCVADADCEKRQVCSDYHCVPGCVSNKDCDSDETCFEKSCVPVSSLCDCPRAPEFCAEDLSLKSSTAGEEICVPEDFDDGVALFFGSVGCSHCRDFFRSVLKISDDLESGGEKPQIIFTQLLLETGKKTPDDFATIMTDKNTHAVQDTQRLAIWDAYQTDWYHLVIIDRNGCFVRKFGPLSETELEEGLADDIKEVWREAMHAECN